MDRFLEGRLLTPYVRPSSEQNAVGSWEGGVPGGRAKFSVLALDITSGSSETGFLHACVNPFWRNEDLYRTLHTRGVWLLLVRKQQLLLKEITKIEKTSLCRSILSGTDDPRTLPSILKLILDAT